MLAEYRPFQRRSRFNEGTEIQRRCGSRSREFNTVHTDQASTIRKRANLPSRWDWQRP
jgi:hypothetical protein